MDSSSPAREGMVKVVTSSQRQQAMSELQGLESSLADVRSSIAEHSKILKELRTKEERLQEEIFQCKQRYSIAQDHVFRSKVAQLESALEKQDLSIRELQAAYERAVAERMKIEDEFKQVIKLASGPEALKKQQTGEAAVATRYELTASQAVRSGRSQDPLAQDPVPTVNRFKHIHETQTGQPSRRYASTINDLGKSAPSPFVHDEEYKVVGKRPEGPRDLGSARFSDWRRPGSRAQQPPGGRSQMSNILG
ncbi:hypothetical protein PTSG_01818 [Salpingoeca rosetta]|uniref:Uncharacterized protein n=1 Tax=Salpingoeca rosetta (strain ATCC 50818 / BSB-021) TaxID=946362 RepID=F2TZ18_SALR5|nr:uncharacterized protein PTSG_01818 [Salpingoeca rosetta]EGD78842.1 hypothetical protein PTSG_01818 [Salpingoeca rosetta]|eukprot:XP_004997798.1 hypothetical protein PTSG_01818 [Salpingoeca rosetta]